MLNTDHITVREIAANSLAAIRVFENFGIDYCCGGNRPLADVCREQGHDLQQVQRELEEAFTTATQSGQDWNTAPLPDLIRHIVDAHHGYLRRELPVLEARLQKVYRVYNERHAPALIGLPQVFTALRTELEGHLEAEEQVHFPAIVAGQASPTGQLENEHESAGRALVRIREITNGFKVPDYACVTYKALMNGLDELERDLHMHIHLENNILFPRSRSLGRLN